MKLSATACRDWLERNKVFFEVFAFLFLGLASVLVSIFNYRISTSELALLEFEHSPVINVKAEHAGDYTTFQVSNLGYHAFSPNVSYASYLKVSSFQDSSLNHPRDVFIELGDFLTYDIFSGNTTGVLFTIAGPPGAEENVRKLTGNCRVRFGQLYSSISTIHLLKVTFLDEKKEGHEAFYFNDAFGTYEITMDSYLEQKAEFDRQNQYGLMYLQSLDDSLMLVSINDRVSLIQGKP